MSKDLNRVSFKEKVGYGFGDLASNLFWMTFAMHMFYFYTDVFKISAAAVGTMFLISRLLDGINDPAMGIIADRTNTRWGKFRPYLFWLAIPLAVMGVITFTVPDLADSGKIIYAYVTYNLIMILYTGINIPYSSLMGVMTADGVERTSISSIKFIFAYSGGLIVSGLLVYVKLLGGGNEALGWQLVMAIFGGAAILFFLITFFTTKERIHPPKNQNSSVFSDLKDLFNNKPWVILLFTGILMILFVATRMSVTNHYFKYFVGDATMFIFGKEIGGGQSYTVFGKEFTTTYEMLTWAYNITSQILSLTGTVFAFWFAKNFGKRRSFIMLFAVAVVATACIVFLKPQNIILLFVFQILGSVSGGPLTPLIWAMYADTADYSEYKSGSRSTGLVFSASTMAQKFGWAIGAFITGILLSYVGFDPDISPTEEVRTGIKYLFSIVPAIAGILAIILMTFYELNDQKMAKIQTELAQRREAES